MPTRIFAITAARETVALDSQGRAEVSFTASNTGSKSIAGRAKIVPLGSAKAAWLSLEGEQERNFAKGEAHQLTVHIAVPPGTPVGKYSFRLNIISVENPDDEFTEGPSVSFEVKELTVAQAPARKFPWWIVAVAGVLVLGGGLITWLLIPQKIPVPDIVVVGKDINKAKVLLQDAKLRLRTEPKSGGKEPGTIVDQNPKKDERVAPGTIITAFVEPEPRLRTEPKSGGKEPGTIVDQTPKKDERVAPEPEKAFVDKYKAAMESKDIAALLSLHYTQGADPAAVEGYKRTLSSEVLESRDKITRFELVNLTPEDVTFVTAPIEPIEGLFTDKLCFNLKPTKKLIIRVERWTDRGNYSTGSDSFVAEKDGKVVVPMLLPCPVEVPSVIGKTIAGSMQESGRCGLVWDYKFGPTIQSIPPPQSTVVWQSPKAGTRVPPRTVLTVSAEPQ